MQRCVLESFEYGVAEYKGVFTQTTHDTHARMSSTSFTPFTQAFEQPAHVVRRPLADGSATPTALFGNVQNELGIAGHRHDLLHVADNTAVLPDGLPEIRRNQHHFFRYKAEENLLEVRPFLIHDPPHKPRLENAASHFRQPTVVRHRLQLLWGAGTG